MRSFGITTLALGLGGLTALIAPAPASACGGFFCDAGPNVMDPEAMPVDQTGETIVFVVEPGHVEAHIQIQYDPESGAERFAWLIPIMGTSPEFSVGSQQLFLNLQNSTVPSYGYTNFQESCGGGGFGDDGGWGGGGDWDGCDGGGYATSGAGDGNSPGGSGEGGDDGETTGGGTEVVSSATVGAFDVVVLQSQTAEELMIWLGDNEFFQDPAAAPILQEYIEEGAQFAAIRLTNGAGIGEVHPLTMRYAGDEPCVPIRLTRIAAQDDMGIRAFFLASARAYPSNYRHVQINPLKLDWIDLASNYEQVVTMAIDTPGVDGHGFVTEYAGSTTAISREDLHSELWSHTEFHDATPAEVPALLTAQGLLSCEDGTCVFEHALIEGLLATYLPVPEGVEPGAFYECIECYEGVVDLEAWDGPRFARAMRQRIIDPAVHAQAILDDNPFVTRLYTTISPHEMTVDPMFHLEAGDLSAVDDTAVTATRNFSCNGRTEMQGVGGRTVRLQPFDQWPDISPDEMPWVERVTEHLPGVAPVVLLDHTQTINDLLVQWNGARSSPRSALCDDTQGDPNADGSATSGCGCRAEDERDGAASWGLLLLALGAGAWGRRRRRR